MAWIVVFQMFGVCVDASAHAAWIARVVSEGLSVFPSQYLSVFMLFHLIGSMNGHRSGCNGINGKASLTSFTAMEKNLKNKAATSFWAPA